MMPSPSLDPKRWLTFLVLFGEFLLPYNFRPPLCVCVSASDEEQKFQNALIVFSQFGGGGLIFQKGSLAAKKVNKAIGDVGMAQEFKEKSPQLD